MTALTTEPDPTPVDAMTRRRRRLVIGMIAAVTPLLILLAVLLLLLYVAQGVVAGRDASRAVSVAQWQRTLAARHTATTLAEAAGAPVDASSLWRRMHDNAGVLRRGGVARIADEALPILPTTDAGVLNTLLRHEEDLARARAARRSLLNAAGEEGVPPETMDALLEADAALLESSDALVRACSAVAGRRTAATVELSLLLLSLIGVVLLVQVGLVLWVRRLNAGLTGEIDRRIDSEQRLRTQEERLRTIVRGILEGIVVVDQHGRIDSVNPAAERIFGTEPGGLVGRPITTLMPSQEWSDRTTYVEGSVIHDRAGAGETIREELGQRLDGSLFPMEVAFSKTRSGDRVLFVAIVRDVSEARRAREELRASHRRLAASSRMQQAILDGTQHAIITTDPDGRIRTFNRGAEAMLGERAEDVLGRAVIEVAFSRAELADAAAEVSATLGEPVEAGWPAVVGLADREGLEQREWTFTTRDGGAIAVLCSVTPLLMPADEAAGEIRPGTVTGPDDRPASLEGFVLVAVDVTERKRAVDEIRRAAAAAEQANRAKGQFLAAMSHELRTPLNSIMGFAYLLRQELTERGHDDLVGDLDRIHGAGQHLLSLINEILDLAKIEAGMMRVDRGSFDLAALARSAAETVRPIAAERGNALAVDCPDDLGPMQSDETKVRQILFNLLSNAAKFTDDGRIELRVRGEITPAGRRAVIEVEDTGIGMTPEQCERVFEEFVQADATAARRHGGTGLGLTLTRRLTELLGGSIEVASTPAAGSTFTVRLPMHLGDDAGEPVVRTGDPAAGERPPAGGTDPAGRRTTILVIDDEKDARTGLVRILERAGYRAVAAADGQSGLDRARTVRPDVITLDIMMPRMDGWAVLQALKADPELAPIPVVMVSMLEGEPTASALGAADVLSKPIDPPALLEVMGRCRPAEAPARALVVDDDPAVRRTVGSTLRSAGWTVREAAGGAEALAALGCDGAAATDDPPPDLVVLDLAMPDVDGLEVLSTMRAAPALANVPVVVLTAQDVPPDLHDRLGGSGARVVRKGEYHGPALLRVIEAAAAAGTGRGPGRNEEGHQ